MATEIITFDPNADGLTGITDYRKEDDDYTPGPGEIELPDWLDRRELHDRQIDMSTTPPSVVHNSDFDYPPPVDGVDDLKQDYRDATTDKGRTDVLYEMITGEKP